MMEAIRTREFTLHFATEELSGEEARLADEINKTIDEFRTGLQQQEAQYGYFDTLLNSVEACLMVVDDGGKVVWMNRSAIDTLCGFRLTDLQMLASLSPNLPQEMMGFIRTRWPTVKGPSYPSGRDSIRPRISWLRTVGTVAVMCLPL